jgi:small subunit ribosomal protein S16
MSLRSLIIRFKPFGRIHDKQYRIVLAQKYRAVNKLCIENLGWYNPNTKKAELKADRIKELVSQNIEMSDSVLSLFKKHNIL